MTEAAAAGFATHPGPRPLPLHLANLLTATTGAVAAFGGFAKDTTGFHPTLQARATDLRQRIAGAGWTPVAEALGKAASKRMETVLEGLETYLNHPFRRPDHDRPVYASIAGVRLLDLGGERGGQPVLLVPSLINPCYVLDLLPNHSLAEYLRKVGFRPLLVDWGTPGPDEKRFRSSDYILSRLVPLMEKVSEDAEAPIPVIGYCMGGNLALAATLAKPDRVEKLALLATPWDFSVGGGAVGAAMATPLLPLIDMMGEAPVDLLQVFFTSLDPTLTETKFRRFAALDPESREAQLFVALEDWSNSGAPLAAGVAHDCLAGWYRDNVPARGEWRVGDRLIDPAGLGCPTLLAIPTRDRIVPPESSLQLANRIAGAKVIRPPSGHVGMIVGSRAPSGLWQPLANWLASDGGPSL